MLLHFSLSLFQYISLYPLLLDFSLMLVLKDLNVDVVHVLHEFLFHLSFLHLIFQDILEFFLTIELLLFSLFFFQIIFFLLPLFIFSNLFFKICLLLIFFSYSPFFHLSHKLLDPLFSFLKFFNFLTLLFIDHFNILFRHLNILFSLFHLIFHFHGFVLLIFFFHFFSHFFKHIFLSLLFVFFSLNLLLQIIY